MDITGLRPHPYFPTSLSQAIPLEDGRILIGILYGAISGSGANPTATVGILDKEWRLTEIGATEADKKDAGVSLLRRGKDAYLIVSETVAAGGAGNSTGMRAYHFPDALPPAVDRTKALAQGIWDACGGMMGVLNRLAQKMRAIVEG